MYQSYINDNGNFMIFYIGIGWKEIESEIVRNVKDEVKGGQKEKPKGIFSRFTSKAHTYFQTGEAWVDGNDFYYVDGEYNLRVIKGATQILH